MRSLIRQAKLLATVESIVCVGKVSFESVTKHAGLIEQELGLDASAVLGIPHYSLSAAGVHKHDASRYRAFVHEALGLQ